MRYLIKLLSTRIKIRNNNHIIAKLLKFPQDVSRVNFSAFQYSEESLEKADANLAWKEQKQRI